MAEKDELQELRAEMAEMRAEIATLRAVPSATVERHNRQTVVSRRGWMKAAAAAAVGGTAAALAPSQPAAALTNFDLGNTTQSDSALTRATYTGASTNRTAFQFRTGTVSINSVRSAALGGVTNLLTHPSGVYGFSGVNSAAGAGVDGVTDQINAYGMRATNSSVTGRAFRAQADRGTAIEAEGGVAFSGFGSQIGLQTGGKVTALYLTPLNQVAPRERNGVSLPGSIDAHLGDRGVDLWATWGGTHNTWRKLSGPDTAGALHPITPGRAYDSRASQPGAVRLSGGSNTTVSVANGRALDSGAVIRPDMVPAGASAITYNLTITDTTGAGFLAVTPGDENDFQAAAINWSAPGTTVGNAGVVKLDGSRQIKVFAGGGSTDFVVDITGYYL